MFDCDCVTVGLWYSDCVLYTSFAGT